MKRKPIAPANDLTIRLSESMIDEYYKEWRSQFMDSIRPVASPPTFIQFIELKIHADQNYRITGKDFLSFIQKLGGTNEKAAEEEKS